MSGNEDREVDKPKVSITLRTIVTGPEAGSIIGKGGETVNSIRDESGAKIRIEGSSPQERIITVDGPTDSIFKAYTLICKTLEGRDRRDRDGRERSRDRTEGLNLNLLVPSSQCGAIIGKEGCKIKEIRETTGAAMHVSGDPLPGSSERSVKVSGSREEVTQCIYHLCCALLECPPKGEPRLYRPDGGFGDSSRGYGGNGSRGRDRDSYRRERSPPGFGGDYNSFEAIADFARRQRGGDGGGRSRNDSRDREQRYEMSVPNDVVGAVIGKRGSKINEIRQISGATINIMEAGSGQRKRERSPDTDRERIIEISGSTTAVTLAKSLINVAMDMGQDGWDRDRDDRRGGRFARTRSRSRERGNGGGYDDRRGRRDKFGQY